MYIFILQKTGEDLQATEDKLNHMNKVKAKLEQTLDEVSRYLQFQDSDLKLNITFKLY